MYSLEVTGRGASNEYPQYMFSPRNKKNIDTFWWKKALYQELCYFASLLLLLLMQIELRKVLIFVLSDSKLHYLVKFYYHIVA